jgi:hypothetical protein
MSKTNATKGSPGTVMFDLLIKDRRAHQPTHLSADESLSSEEDGDELVSAMLKILSVVHHRPTRGHITLKSRVSHAQGMAALLCVSQGCVSVVGGADLDETLLCAVPSSHVVVEPVSYCSNFGFYIATTIDLDNSGTVFILLPTRSARDRWLAALSDMGVEVKGCNDGVGEPGHPLSLHWSRALKDEWPLCNSGTLPLIRWLS